MDVIALSFYAVICGVLGWAAPNLGAPVVRLGIGAVVGVIAASLLPYVKAMLAG